MTRKGPKPKNLEDKVVQLSICLDRVVKENLMRHADKLEISMSGYINSLLKQELQDSSEEQCSSKEQ